MSSVQDINTIRASAEQQAHGVFTASGASSVPAVKLEDITAGNTAVVKTEPTDHDTTGQVEVTPANTPAVTNPAVNTPAANITATDPPAANTSAAKTPAGKLEGFYNARGDFEMLYVETQPIPNTTGRRGYRSSKKIVEETGTNRVTGKQMYRSSEPSDKYIENMAKMHPSGTIDRLPSPMNDAVAGDELRGLLDTIATDTASHAFETAVDVGADESAMTDELLLDVATKTKAAKDAQKALDAHLAREAAKKGTTPARRAPQKKTTSTASNVPATPARHTRASASRLSGDNASDPQPSDGFTASATPATNKRKASAAKPADAPATPAAPMSDIFAGYITPSSAQMSDAFNAPATPATNKRKASATKPAADIFNGYITPSSAQMSDVFNAPGTAATTKRKASAAKPVADTLATPSAPKRTRATAQLDSPDDTSPEQVTPPTPTPSRKKLKLNVSKSPTPEPALPKLKLRRTSTMAAPEVKQTATPDSDAKTGSASAAADHTNAPSTPAPARRSARATKVSQTPSGNGGDDSDDDSDDERKKLPKINRDPSPVGKRRTRKRKQEDDEDDDADSNVSDDAAATPSPAKKARSTPKKMPATPRNKNIAGPSTPKTPGLRKDGSAKKAPKEVIPKSYKGSPSQKGYSLPAPPVPNTLDTPWRCGNLACTSGMTWLPRDDNPNGDGPLGRKVISQYFGRNKASTRLIPDEVWHYFCRKDYQRQTYDAKKSGPAFAAFVISQVRDQLQRMRVWRPDAQFEVALSKAAQDRLATYQAIKSANNNDATVAAAKMPQPGSKGKHANPTPEEATPPALLERFNQQFVSNNNMGGILADYNRLEAILTFNENEIAAGNTTVLMPFEFLVCKQADGETIDDTDNFEKWRCQKQNIAYPDTSSDN